MVIDCGSEFFCIGYTGKKTERNMKMKILMVTTGMDIGGAETHIAELCRSFTEKGLSVTVASSGGVFVSELRKNGIFHVTLPLDQKTPSALAEAYKGLRELIRRE